MGVVSQCHTPTILPLEKEPQYPLQGKLGVLQGQSRWVMTKENPLSTLGFEPQTIRPIPSHYPDYAIPAPNIRLPYVMKVTSVSEKQVQ
jgi:predicted DNA-binding transcriptional regulator AlpA